MLSNLSQSTNIKSGFKNVLTENIHSFRVGGLDMLGKPLIVQQQIQCSRTNISAVSTYFNNVNEPLDSGYKLFDIYSETMGYNGVNELIFGAFDASAKFLKIKLVDDSELRRYPNLKKLIIHYGHSSDSEQEIYGDLTSANFLHFQQLEYLHFSISGHANVMLMKFNKPNLYPNLKHLFLRNINHSLRIEGEVKYIPRQLTYLNLTDKISNSSIVLTGKISDFPTRLNFLDATWLTNASFSGYEQTNWLGEAITSIDIERVTLTSSELDQLLIDFSVANWTTTETGVLRLIQRTTGSIGVRTSASDSAVALLQSKGVTITISNNTF